MTYADTYNLRDKSIVKLNDMADAVDALNGQINAAWTAYTPTYGGSASMTYGSVTKLRAEYLQIGKLLIVCVRTTAGTVGGTVDYSILVSSPVSLAANTGACNVGCWIYENGAWKIGHVGYNAAGFIGIEKADASKWTAGDAYLSFTAILATA